MLSTPRATNLEWVFDGERRRSVWDFLPSTKCFARVDFCWLRCELLFAASSPLLTSFCYQSVRPSFDSSPEREGIPRRSSSARSIKMKGGVRGDIQVMQGHKIVADGWAGACNPHPHPRPPLTHTLAHTYNRNCSIWNARFSTRSSRTDRRTQIKNIFAQHTNLCYIFA